MTFKPIGLAIDHTEPVKGASTLRLCPVCQGTGEWDTPSNMGPGVPNCPVCKGCGYVDLASVCCCGQAALFFKDDVIYCGKDVCLSSLKHKRVGFGI
jgi:hypothetical protein